MTRISRSLVCQYIGPDDGIVLMDESAGTEITIPVQYVGTLITALLYFAHPAPEPDTPESVEAKLKITREITNLFRRYSS